VEVDEVPKILPNGQVTFEADARDAAATALVDAGHDPAGVAVVTGTEHPADGTMSPPVGNDGDGGQVADVPAPGAAPAPEPAVHVPPRPPRRTPPGGA